MPFDLVRLIATATPNNPFIVTLMQPDDFFDFKAAADMNVQTSKLQISKAKWIYISADSPGLVKIRQTFNDMERWKSVNVLKKNMNIEKIKRMNILPLKCENQIHSRKRTDIEAI